MALEPNDQTSSKQTDSTSAEPTKGKADYLSSLPPGSLIGTDWSRAPALDLKESQITALRDLIRKQTNKEMAARREEILRVWEAELFWRGYQHLLPVIDGFGWEICGYAGGSGRTGTQRSMYEANFYLAYGMSVVNALTRKVPTVKFEPNSPQEDVDITAADAANQLVDLVKRNNDLLSLMSDMARFLYTDGRASFYTRYVKNGPRFGFKKPDEQKAFNPEEASADEAGVPAPGESGQSPNTGTSSEEGQEQEEVSVPEPRGQQVITCHGALEVKYPMKINCQSEAGWLVWSREVDLSIAQGKYPKKAKDIKVALGGIAGDDIDRLARVNVNLGMENNFITSDSECYDVTIQDAWLRDCTLLEIKDDQVRDELLALSKGTGLHITFAGETFLEAKQETMDDHWTLIFALPGDGIHRPGLGTSYIPIQKIENNLLELRNDYLINGIPMMWMDSDTFDMGHFKDQSNTPGGKRPFTADPTRPASELIVQEPIIQFPQGLNEAIEDLGKGQIAQILTGVFPALSGDDTGNNDTGIGMKMQRDNALGRIGITWRNIKCGMASVMMQAVQCLAKNHDDNITLAGLEKGADPIIVELQDLKGQFHCEPDTDENYPESWTDVQQRVTDLMDPNKTNPELLSDFNAPQNYKLMKRATGLTAFIIPKETSYEKQLGEIEDLKKGSPLPNPQIMNLEQQILSISNTNPQDPQLVQLQQQLQGLPKEISSVEIDPDVDDNRVHADTCLAWLNGVMGRAFKDGTEQQRASYANVRLHYMEHKKVADDNDSKNKQIPEKGITKSISADALVKVGIPLEQAIKVIQSL